MEAYDKIRAIITEVEAKLEEAMVLANEHGECFHFQVGPKDEWNHNLYMKYNGKGSYEAENYTEG